MGKRRYEAAGGVVIHEGAMLLLDRPAHGEIRLPKGHIEAGESAVDAALRETEEESGYADLEVVADLGSQVVEFSYKGDDVVRTEHFFLMRLHSDRQAPRSVQDDSQFRPIWLPVEDALLQLTYAAERETARRAIAAFRAAG